MDDIKINKFYFTNEGIITLTEAGLAWKVQNFTFCHFCQLKIYHTHKHSNTCHGLNFHCYLIFLNAHNDVLYQNQYQLQSPKNTYLWLNDPLNTSTFRNTSNPLKLYEITLFLTGSSACYHFTIQFTKVLSHHFADDTWTSNVYHGLNFHHRDLKFSDIVPNTIMIMNKN